MAESWKEAKECARKEALPQVYHDCDANTYGACNAGERQGSFKGGVYRTSLPVYASTPEHRRTRRKREEIPPGKPGLVTLLFFPDLMPEPVHDIVHHQPELIAYIFPRFYI